MKPEGLVFIVVELAFTPSPALGDPYVVRTLKFENLSISLF